MVFLPLLVFSFSLDNDTNEEIGSNVEFNAFLSATQITGLSEPSYEEVDMYYYVNNYQASEERTAEMNPNIAYVVTKQIQTKTNAAYTAVGGLQHT